MVMGWPPLPMPPPLGLSAIVESTTVIVPSEKIPPPPFELALSVMVELVTRDDQAQGEQREGNREDPIAERLEPSGIHPCASFVHPGSRRPREQPPIRFRSRPGRRRDPEAGWWSASVSSDAREATR